MHVLAERIQQEYPRGFIKAVEWRGDVAVTVTREFLHDIARFVHDDPDIDCDYIVHVSSVDWPDDDERFEVVYEVYSIRKRHRIRLKTRVPESDCIVDSRRPFGFRRFAESQKPRRVLTLCLDDRSAPL